VKELLKLSKTPWREGKKIIIPSYKCELQARQSVGLTQGPDLTQLGLALISELGPKVCWVQLMISLTLN
jgi:hypothetical protein